LHPWAHPVLDEPGVQRAIQTFEQHGDERGLASAWSASADLRFDGFREREGLAAMSRALEQAERGSDRQFQALIRLRLAIRIDGTSAPTSSLTSSTTSRSSSGGRGGPRSELDGR
jgi:hypothetical protein